LAKKKRRPRREGEKDRVPGKRRDGVGKKNPAWGRALVGRPLEKLGVKIALIGSVRNKSRGEGRKSGRIEREG